MARKIPREFVPLDLNMPRDPKIRRAGPDAELLYIRGLIYLKSADSDGIIPDYDLDVVGAGLKNITKSRDALVRVELWDEVEGGWVCRSWLKWNLSQAEQADERDQKRVGALKSNHAQGRHAESPSPECPMCTRGVTA